MSLKPVKSVMEINAWSLMKLWNIIFVSVKTSCDDQKRSQTTNVWKFHNYSNKFIKKFIKKYLMSNWDETRWSCAGGMTWSNPTEVVCFADGGSAVGPATVWWLLSVCKRLPVRVQRSRHCREGRRKQTPPLSNPVWENKDRN